MRPKPSCASGPCSSPSTPWPWCSFPSPWSSYAHTSTRPLAVFASSSCSLCMCHAEFFTDALGILLFIPCSPMALGPGPSSAASHAPWTALGLLLPGARLQRAPVFLPPPWPHLAEVPAAARPSPCALCARALVSARCCARSPLPTRRRRRPLPMPSSLCAQPYPSARHGRFPARAAVLFQLPAVCSPGRTLALLGHVACCACVCSVPMPMLQVCQSAASRQFAANVQSPVCPCARPPARRDGLSPLAGCRSPNCHGQRIDAPLQQPLILRRQSTPRPRRAHRSRRSICQLRATCVELRSPLSCSTVEASNSSTSLASSKIQRVWIK